MEFITTPLDSIAGRVAAAREAFDRGTTRPYSWRVTTLERLRALLVAPLSAAFGARRWQSTIFCVR